MSFEFGSRSSCRCPTKIGRGGKAFISCSCPDDEPRRPNLIYGMKPSEWNKMRRAVLARDGSHCRYCGDATDDPHCDHVIPWTKGGATTLGNLTVACPPCNSSKRNRTPEEWAASGNARARLLASRALQPEGASR